MATKKARARRATKRRRVPKKKPSSVVVAQLKRGEVRVRVPASATRQEREEAAQFARTLESNNQIAEQAPLPPGTTHQIETDPKGNKTLVRKRFSSI